MHIVNTLVSAERLLACFRTCWGFMPCCQKESEAFWSCYNAEVVTVRQLCQQVLITKSCPLTSTAPGQDPKQTSTVPANKEALEERDWERAASRSL